MRIAVFAPDPATSDGIALHTRRLVDAWESAGNVVLWAYPDRGTYVAVAHGPTRATPDPADKRPVGAALRAFRPDISIVQFAISSVKLSIGALVSTTHKLKRSGVPVLVCCHEASRELALLGPLARPIYAALRAGASSFIAFSEVEASRMMQSGLADHVTAVPLGSAQPAIDPSAVKRVVETYGLSDPCVLAVGWITHSKGTDLLLKAAPTVARNLGGVQFVIAGAPRPRTGLFRIFGWADERYAARLGSAVTATALTWPVKFTGHVPEEDLDPLMQAATAIVLPYRSATQSSIAARALAAGTATVASDLDGLVAQLGGAAHYFRAGDHDHLATVLSEVLGNPELRASLVAAATRRVAEESYTSVAEAILGQKLAHRPHQQH